MTTTDEPFAPFLQKLLGIIEKKDIVVLTQDEVHHLVGLYIDYEISSVGPRIELHRVAKVQLSRKGSGNMDDR